MPNDVSLFIFEKHDFQCFSQKASGKNNFVRLMLQFLHTKLRFFLVPQIELITVAL